MRCRSRIAFDALLEHIGRVSIVCSVCWPYNFRLLSFRTMARKHKNADILEECDKIRDAVLPRLGVRFEDHGDSTVIKLVDPETLIREQEQKKALQETRRLEKERNKLEMERNKLEKERKQREKEVTLI